MDWRDRGLGLKLKFEAKVLDTFKCHSEIELERTLKSLSKDFRVISQSIQSLWLTEVMLDLEIRSWES